MRDRFSRSVITVAVASAAVSVGIAVSVTHTSAQAPSSNAALKTAWGEPDLQGIWTDETATPLQRPAKYADQEFFSEKERQDLDAARATMLDRDKRSERGTERDVSGAYNSAFLSIKR